MQNLIAKLFGVSRSTITEHINNILNTGELIENNTVGNSDGNNSKKVKIYNLDIIKKMNKFIKTNLIKFNYRGFLGKWLRIITLDEIFGILKNIVKEEMVKWQKI